MCFSPRRNYCFVTPYHLNAQKHRLSRASLLELFDRKPSRPTLYIVGSGPNAHPREFNEWVICSTGIERVRKIWYDTDEYHETFQFVTRSKAVSRQDIQLSLGNTQQRKTSVVTDVSWPFLLHASRSIPSALLFFSVTLLFLHRCDIPLFSLRAFFFSLQPSLLRRGGSRNATERTILLLFLFRFTHRFSLIGLAQSPTLFKFSRVLSIENRLAEQSSRERSPNRKNSGKTGQLLRASGENYTSGTSWTVVSGEDHV